MREKTTNNLMGEEFQEKPFGGYIGAWALHDMSRSLSKTAARSLFLTECPLAVPAMFTGIIEHDYLGRWRDGSSMRSWWIVSIMPSENAWNVETLNTRYQLVGPGRITGSVPVVYDFDVGKTLAALDSSSRLNPEMESLGTVVCPEDEGGAALVLALSEVINAKNSGIRTRIS